jgi:hypothetical protein
VAEESEKSVESERVAPSTSEAASANIPLAARLAVEIPKPKDWQAFQRNCILLFS